MISFRHVCKTISCSIVVTYLSHTLQEHISQIYQVQSVAPTPWGTGARAPNFYKWLGTRGTVSRRTANKKLTKLY